MKVPSGLMKVCKCGCGQEVASRFQRGHNLRIHNPAKVNRTSFVKGQIPWNKGLKGLIPWNKGKTNIYSSETIEKMRNASTKPIRLFHNMSRETLVELYDQKRLSQRAIAELCRVSIPTVLYRLKKLGIEPHSHALKGSRNPHWISGKQKARGGYIRVWLDENSPYYLMTDHHGTVMEHRLVMAQHLGRCLEKWEIVHHKGTKYPMGSKEDKADNRLENLQLLPSIPEHLPSIRLQQSLRGLEKKAEEQLRLIKLLQWQIKEMQEEIAILKKERSNARS